MLVNSFNKNPQNQVSPSFGLSPELAGRATRAARNDINTLELLTREAYVKGIKGNVRGRRFFGDFLQQILAKMDKRKKQVDRFVDYKV